MRKTDSQLRTESLVFYEKDVRRLEGELDGFLELSGARCAMLIDKDGHLVTRRGEPLSASIDAIAALIAGSFAATKELARLFGEEEFANMFHQGMRESIQLQLIGPRTLLGVVFDDRTNLGLVRFYSQETSTRLEEILAEIAERPSEPGIGLADTFSSDATAALDNLF